MSAPKTDPLTLLVGDAAEMLRTLPDGSVQCCVTSPPYWGLRDYGTARWEGGDAGCDHLVGTFDKKRGDRERFSGKDKRPGPTCAKCGAVRIDNQIGLEPTPEAFVERLVGVFREVRRVLKDDGTLWMNLGDSYANETVGKRSGGTLDQWKNGGRREPDVNEPRRKGSGLAPKNLIGIPWMVAFALRADGWYLRQDIIWHKPNPMPESVTDRCTKAHEYLFLLTKSQRYYYDREAIAEAVSPNTHARLSQNVAAQIGSTRANGGAKTNGNMKAVGKRKLGTAGEKNNASFDAALAIMPDTRNKRSVWVVPTEGYSEAHFATYPPDLIRPCILAGSRPGDVVLDPFGGSGTTGQVALEMGRRAVLVELNPEYAALCRQRTNVTMGMF